MNCYNERVLIRYTERDSAQNGPSDDSKDIVAIVAAIDFAFLTQAKAIKKYGVIIYSVLRTSYRLYRDARKDSGVEQDFPVMKGTQQVVQRSSYVTLSAFDHGRQWSSSFKLHEKRPSIVDDDSVKLLAHGHKKNTTRGTRPWSWARL